MLSPHHRASSVLPPPGLLESHSRHPLWILLCTMTVLVPHIACSMFETTTNLLNLGARVIERTEPVVSSTQLHQYKAWTKMATPSSTQNVQGCKGRRQAKDGIINAALLSKTIAAATWPFATLTTIPSWRSKVRCSELVLRKDIPVRWTSPSIPFQYSCL